MNRFDPFENRKCRDIRNALSRGFLRSLAQHDLTFLIQDHRAVSRDLEPFHHQWIQGRMVRYQWVLSQPVTALDQGMVTATLLWDARLFYECHEWLEEIWLDLEGEEKKAVQGLIRAAGAYVFVEARRPETARKTAVKALALLRDHQGAVPPIFQPQKLMGALDPLDPTPPCLNAHPVFPGGGIVFPG